MSEEYFETAPSRFIGSTGEFIQFHYYPARMGSHSIAKALFYGFPNNKEPYLDALMNHYSGMVEDIFTIFGSHKPTRKEKTDHNEKIAQIKTIIRANLEMMVVRIIEQKNDFISKNESGNLGYDQKGLNNMILDNYMREALSYLSISEHFSKVCGDYRLVQEVKASPDRFSDLEELCKFPLQHFLKQHRMKNMDKEDQYQEGLLVVWNCMHKYAGKNFSRFSSMVNQSLHNRFVDLVRFNAADVRRINKMTTPVGSTLSKEESYLMVILEKLSANAWVLAQRDTESFDDSGKSIDNPFLSLGLEDFGLAVNQVDRLTVRFADNWEIVDESNFPYDSERKMLLYSKTGREITGLDKSVLGLKKKRKNERTFPRQMPWFLEKKEEAEEKGIDISKGTDPVSRYVNHLIEISK